MKCSRCDLRNTKGGRHICDMCHLSILDNNPVEFITDIEILEYYIHSVLWEGCQECGSHDFHCDAGTKEEDDVKWYIIQVRCPNCNINYEQIMEVRMNEFNKNKQRTHGK